MIKSVEDKIMAKFVIECPVCGKYAEGKTGFFSSKKINCSCGNTINVKTDKYTSRTCAHCGNDVIFDQSKGDKAICPVCRETINAFTDMSKVQEIACVQCGVHLIVNRGSKKYVCPVCDCENDVKERVVSEKIKHDGLASIIKYEGDNDIFIWKHPIEDFNYGSQLIVHESQEAIFFKDGQALDLFGPGRYTLENQQLPLLEKIYSLPTDAEGTFHAEVYFINKTVQMSIKWGTPDKVRFIDPLSSTPLEIGASGTMNLQIDNARKLLVKLVGTTKGISWEEGPGLTKSIQASFRPLIVSAVKTNLSSVIKNEAIDLLEIDEKLDIISDSLKNKILPEFEEYGLTIPQLYVTSIVLPEDDPNFKRIRELHTLTLQTRMIQAEATVKTAQAQSEAQYRTAQEQSKAAIEAAHRDAELQRQLTEIEVAKREAERKVIEAQAETQAQRMQGLTEAEIMKAKGYTEKDVLQADVQKAYAEGIGSMGPAISSGGGSGIIGDMMGIGVGVAAASAIAPQIGGMMQGFNPNTLQNATPQNNTLPNIWDCCCGQKGIVGNFCSNCGQPRPKLAETELWNCCCGKTGITRKFCSNCGAKKPETPPIWNCSCGQTGNTGDFCNNCGKKRGE